MMVKKETEQAFRNIRLIIYDFDGVMTNNHVIVDQTGNESVVVHRGDGYGVARIRELGIDQIIVSTETNPVVERRGEKLRIGVAHGVQEKKEMVDSIRKAKGYALDETMFIGNDLNDYDAMASVGLKGCPADAEKEILEISDWISNANGGNGVIRDLYRVLDEARKIK